MQPSAKATAPPLGFKPLRLGEHPALDFLNSVLAPSGRKLDFLYDAASFARWLSGSGVVPQHLAAAAKVLPSRQLDLLAAEARELREWFRALLTRCRSSGDGSLRRAELRRLNRLISEVPLTQRVVRGTDGFELVAQRDCAEPRALISELAAACADLLARQRRDRLRQCENPACTLVFADNKRGPRRRWCSMALCGNRMKVAAYRARRAA